MVDSNTKKPKKKTNETQEEILEEIQNDSEDENSIMNRSDSINLRDYNNENNEIDGNSKYIQIFEPDGSTKVVLKSSIVWMLSEPEKK